MVTDLKRIKRPNNKIQCMISRFFKMLSKTFFGTTGEI